MKNKEGLYSQIKSIKNKDFNYKYIIEVFIFISKYLNI